MKKYAKILRSIALSLVLCTLFSYGIYAVETEPDIEPDIEEFCVCGL